MFSSRISLRWGCHESCNAEQGNQTGIGMFRGTGKRTIDLVKTLSHNFVLQVRLKELMFHVCTMWRRTNWKVLFGLV